MSYLEAEVLMKADYCGTVVYVPVVVVNAVVLELEVWGSRGNRAGMGGTLLALLI